MCQPVLRWDYKSKEKVHALPVFTTVWQQKHLVVIYGFSQEFPSWNSLFNDDVWRTLSWKLSHHRYLFYCKFHRGYPKNPALFPNLTFSLISLIYIYDIQYTAHLHNEPNMFTLNMNLCHWYTCWLSMKVYMPIYFTFDSLFKYV
jgi:hypothetical protein